MCIGDNRLKIIKTLGQDKGHRHGGISLRMIKPHGLLIAKPLSSCLIIPWDKEFRDSCRKLASVLLAHKKWFVDIISNLLNGILKMDIW